MSDSKKIGDPCPSCGAALARRAQLFYWRGTYYDGAFCQPCNSMWAIYGEEMPPLRPVPAMTLDEQFAQAREEGRREVRDQFAALGYEIVSGQVMTRLDGRLVQIFSDEK